MKRVIKFRIWNNKTKAWIHGPHERSCLDGVNLFGEVILLGELLNGVSLEDLNKIIALQFTGLKDKNGKDIFEGDIVKTTRRSKEEIALAKIFSDDITPYTYTNGEIKFTNQAWQIYQNDIGRTRLSKYVCCDAHPKLEIIGNIFETPELLNEN